MDQSAKQQSQAMAAAVTPHAKDGPVLNTSIPEVDINHVYISSARLYDAQPKENYGQPNRVQISVPEKAPTSSHAPQWQMEENDGGYQKIPRLWASKLEATVPAEQHDQLSSQHPTATSANYNTLLRWYHETVEQGPYDNIGGVRNMSAVPSHNDSLGTSSEDHPPSQNSATWGSLGELRE